MEKLKEFLRGLGYKEVNIETYGEMKENFLKYDVKIDISESIRENIHNISNLDLINSELQLNIVDTYVQIMVKGIPIIHIEKLEDPMIQDFVTLQNKHEKMKGLEKCIHLFVVTDGVDTRMVVNNEKLRYIESFEWYGENGVVKQVSEIDKQIFNPLNIIKYMLIGEEVNMLKQFQIEAINRLKVTGIVQHYPKSGKTNLGYKLGKTLHDSSKIFYITDQQESIIENYKEYHVENKTQLIKNIDNRLTICSYDTFKKSMGTLAAPAPIRKYSEQEVAIIIDNLEETNVIEIRNIINRTFKNLVLIGITHQDINKFTNEVKEMFNNNIIHTHMEQGKELVYDTKTQVKSKKRVEEHAEVFTNPREVKAMLNMIGNDAKKIESTYLEPACGTGNFLVEILARKIARVERKYRKEKMENYEVAMMLAVSSIYGIDIQIDNVETSRDRMMKQVEKSYKKCFKVEERNEFIEQIEFVMGLNIMQGNTLGDTPMIISKWERDNYDFTRYDFIYQELVKGKGHAEPHAIYEKINYIKMNRAKEV